METMGFNVPTYTQGPGPFVPFPKIARLNRDVVITEKIDGTNASITICEGGGPIVAGSRKRWITPEDDNFGFAAWVRDHATELRELGPGTHFGEWWGQGIQRGYGAEERYFSLFNSGRWLDPFENMSNTDESLTIAPACCRVVPVLWVGELRGGLERVLHQLRTHGSAISPGFKAEGVVIWHTAARTLFKVTLEHDEKPKGSTE